MPALRSRQQTCPFVNQIRISQVISFLFFIKEFNNRSQQQPLLYTTSVECIIFLLYLIKFHVLFVIAPKHKKSTAKVDSKLSSSDWPKNEIKIKDFEAGESLMAAAYWVSCSTIAVPSRNKSRRDISCGRQYEYFKNIRSGDPCNRLTWQKCVLNIVMTTAKAGVAYSVGREDWTCRSSWVGLKWWELIREFERKW